MADGSWKWIINAALIVGVNNNTHDIGGHPLGPYSYLLRIF